MSKLWMGLEGLGRFAAPTLFIWGEEDVLIPAEESRRLYERAVSVKKRLIILAGSRSGAVMDHLHEEVEEAIVEFVYTHFARKGRTDENR